MKNRSLWVMAYLALGASTAVQAGEFTLGAGAVAFKSPYKDFKDNSAPMIFAEYEGENFVIGSTGAHYRVMGSDDTPLSLFATLSSVGSGFKAKDSTYFTGMEDRDSSIDLGMTAIYRVGDAGEISASLLHDVSGAYKGFFADVSYSHAFDIAGRASFSPSVGVSILSKDYVDYYYGVRATEATPSRAAYTGKAAMTPYVGYDVVMPISNNWSLFHATQYTWLGDNIKKSPLVERDNSWSTTLGVAYTF